MGVKDEVFFVGIVIAIFVGRSLVAPIYVVASVDLDISGAFFSFASISHNSPSAAVIGADRLGGGSACAHHHPHPKLNHIEFRPKNNNNAR